MLSRSAHSGHKPRLHLITLRATALSAWLEALRLLPIPARHGLLLTTTFSRRLEALLSAIAHSRHLLLRTTG